MFEWCFEVPLAYIGPGAGLSMLGALLAVACVIVLALVSPILYLFSLGRSWLRKRVPSAVTPAATGLDAGTNAKPGV